MGFAARQQFDGYCQQRHRLLDVHVQRHRQRDVFFHHQDPQLTLKKVSIGLRQVTHFHRAVRHTTVAGALSLHELGAGLPDEVVRDEFGEPHMHVVRCEQPLAPES